MANYKNLTFSNTLEGFKNWSYAFPPMDKEAVKAVGFKKHENYYLECQLVNGFLNAGSFVSASVREYNEAEKDFNYVGVEKEQELLGTVFKSKVESFTKNHLNN